MLHILSLQNNKKESVKCQELKIALDVQNQKRPKVDFMITKSLQKIVQLKTALQKVVQPEIAQPRIAVSSAMIDAH